MDLEGGWDHLVGLYLHASLPNTDVNGVILLYSGATLKMKGSLEAPTFRFGWFSHTMTQPGCVFP